MDRYKHNNSIRCIGLQRRRLRVTGPIIAGDGDAVPLARRPHGAHIAVATSDHAAYLATDKGPAM